MREVDRKFYEKIKERSHGLSSIIGNKIMFGIMGWGGSGRYVTSI